MRLSAFPPHAGIAVERRDEGNTDDYGTFARVHDPEGLAIELWQPPAPPAPPAAE